MAAEDPLFILYTSGSTGKPKGVLHTTAGYLLGASITHKYVFDYHEGDIYWCTADVGWVTGHSYIVYGPLANGATTLMFEGVPTYPDVSRFWQVIDKHKVNIFYTAPTAIRALMASGDEPVTRTSRSSLRLLGSVGEPINPEAWEWYYRVVGENRCPIVDTWWQTETGAIMITPLPGVTDLKPGSASLPFFGVKPALLDADGNELDGVATGNLVLGQTWPSQLRSIYGDHQRCIDTYFTAYPGYYFTGDSAHRDADGYYWVTGRVDDVIMFLDTVWALPRLKVRWYCTQASPKRRWLAIRTTSKGKRSMPMSPLWTGSMNRAISRRLFARSWLPRLVLSRAPRLFNSPRGCRRRVLAKSCAAFFVRSRPTNSIRSAIQRLSQNRLWLNNWLQTARTNRLVFETLHARSTPQ